MVAGWPTWLTGEGGQFWQSELAASVGRVVAAFVGHPMATLVGRLCIFNSRFGLCRAVPALTHPPGSVSLGLVPIGHHQTKTQGDALAFCLRSGAR